jgi:hypothetical protein
MLDTQSMGLREERTMTEARNDELLKQAEQDHRGFGPACQVCSAELSAMADGRTYCPEGHQQERRRQ